jgi:hypothetical protein
MSIVLPKERRIICSDDEDYTIRINVLSPYGLTEEDEELLHLLSLYTPRCKFREGDIALLTHVPEYMKKGRTKLPKFWKVRFVITRWAWDLVKVATHYGSTLSAEQAMTLLENFKHYEKNEKREPLIFGHGYPHGKNKGLVTWLPYQYLRQTIHSEPTEPWEGIVHEFSAEYAGYDDNEIKRSFHWDLEPNNYHDGRNLDHPLVAEEPLVQKLYMAGLGSHLESPYIIGEPDRLRPIDRDHDVFAHEEE